jgi:hypothetical protein
MAVCLADAEQPLLLAPEAGRLDRTSAVRRECLRPRRWGVGRGLRLRLHSWRREERRLLLFARSGSVCVR